MVKGAMTVPHTPETLVYGIKAASDPRIAPDGRQIIYALATTDQGTQRTSSQLWLCDLDGGNARQLTHEGEHNAGARWPSDGRHLAFVSDRGQGSGLFLLPMREGGDARELTRHRQAISQLAWSPDGTRLAYVTEYDPDNPDEIEQPKDAAPAVRVTRRLDYKHDTRGWVGDRTFQVFVVDVESGQRRRASHDAVDHSGPQWSPDGRWLGVLRGSPYVSSIQLVLLPMDGTGTEQRIDGGDGSIGSWAWSPDGGRILYAADPDNTTQHDFFVYDVATGSSRRLTDDLACEPSGGYDFDSSGAPVWLDERQVLFLGAEHAASGLYVIDSDSGTVEPLQRWQALNNGFSVDAAGRYVVQGTTSFETVGELAVHDLQAGTSQRITTYNTELLAERPLAGWERFEVERGAFTIEGWLLKPPGADQTQRYPLVLDIHGGPQWYFGYYVWPWQQVLATNGFLVAFANPRGSATYGRRFVTQVKQDWGGEDYQDLMAVIDQLTQRSDVDAGRLGVHGYSYGGYMTSWILGHTGRFKAAAVGAPVFDFESFRGTSDIGFGWGEEQFGGAPHAAREAYAQHSPSEFIHHATTPTLILHGEDDFRCPIGQGEQLFVALKRAGVEAEFVRYPGADHLFPFAGQPAYRVDYCRRLLTWFSEHL